MLSPKSKWRGGRHRRPELAGRRMLSQGSIDRRTEPSSEQPLCRATATPSRCVASSKSESGMERLPRCQTSRADLRACQASEDRPSSATLTGPASISFSLR